MSRLPRLLACLGFCLLIDCATATAKRPLSPQDLDGWRSLDTPILSRDGHWLAYADMPQVDDGFLVVRDLVTGREFREPVGARPPAPFPPPRIASPEETPPPQNIIITLTSDSRFAVASTFPSKAEMVRARKQKKRPEEMPRNGLLILNLATGKTVRVPAVTSHQVPARGGAWLAYLKGPKPEPPLPAATGKQKKFPPPAKKPLYGTDLVLRDLASGTERVFAHVLEYAFARDGRTLLYAVSSKAGTDNGIYAFSPGGPAGPVALLTGRGRYLKLSWDRPQTQAAWISDRDDHAAKSPKFTAYRWLRDANTPVAVKSKYPSGLDLSDKAPPAFSRDGRKLYVGLAPAGAAEPEAATILDSEDKVTADLWSWKDGYVQPEQEARAIQERNRTYRGVFDLATGAYAQLADAALPTVTLSDDGTRALGFDDRAYRSRRDFDNHYSDIYLVDTTSGERRRVLEALRGNTRGGPTLAWSPDGRWASYYLDAQWHLLDTASGATREISSKLPVKFAKEDHDMPEPPPSYGWAGWTSDSTSILVYDRFDVWRLFTDGSPAVNLTSGAGRAGNIALRVQNVEPHEVDDDERGINPIKPLILRGESEATRATGFYRTTFAATSAPDRLLWADCSYAYAGRALDADVLLVTASRFDEFPDVQTTNSSFANLKKVTTLGAQLDPFLWGRAELIDFTNADGVPLKAALIKPADFDPGKKYPLIVFIYERLTQIVHRFSAPAPGTNISFPYYASNGYLVLMPDIVYTKGQPGPSALKCVLPAIDAVSQMGFLDEQAIGIQGHSWGGYQIAYMITQTKRFKAAEAGAPVGNMTSGYGGIRWGPGLPRLFQYEQNQSRIGPPLTDAPELYLENSPVFHIKNVQTPLLILHNDHDEAVPWEQGIELFLALRRYNKPVWFFNYNQELHGLRRRADQKDFTQRMWQFFDHFLRGAPAPAWLERGIPYLDRDAEKLRFNAPPG